MEAVGHLLSAEQAAHFPAHGWALEWSGRRSLYLPILSVFEEVSTIRRRRGVSDPLDLAECDRATRSFANTFWKLVVTLRELEALARGVGRWADDDDLGQTRAVFEHAPLFVDLAFVYLRRLADRFAQAIDPVLFRDRSSPRSKFRALSEYAMSAEESDLLVNRERLLEVLSESSWLERLQRLREIRNSLEHDSIYVDIALVTERDPAGVSRHRIDALTSVGPIDDELVQAIREVCSDLCSFLAGVHRLVGYGNEYRSSDELPVPGPDDLVIAFWPPI